MRGIFKFTALVGLLAAMSEVPAHGQTLICFKSSSGTGCTPVSAGAPLPVTGSFSATTTGFAPATTGTPISVTSSAGGVTGTLPAGAVVVASNVGTTNSAYCKLGASATTSDQLIAPNSWFAFTVGVATQLTCITSTSTTTVNMVGGSGLPTGAGGGGGGGSGGSVTQGTDPWLIAGKGTAGSASGGVVTVQGVASMTPFLVTLTGTNNVTNSGTFAVQAAQSGTWTVQPGNTANTTAWLVTGTGGTFPATQSGTWNITNISGTVSLPTGAATAANQTTANSSLATIATNTGAAIPAQAVGVPIGGFGLCDGANGSTNPCTTVQTVLAASTAAAAANKPAVVALHPSSGTPAQINQYPFGATPITASATGTTGATTATLAGTSGKTTYICGYSIRANATAATTVTNTITGVITATLSSIMWVAPLASGIGVDEQIFSPCIPASGTNQAIAVVSGAPGSGGTVSSKGWGYQL